MDMKKVSQIILILFLLSPLWSFAQTSKELGLVVTGKNTSVKVFARGLETYFRFVIRVNFENQGTGPIILINPLRSSGTGLKEARFFSRENKTSEKVFEPNPTRVDAFKAMIQYFSEPSPPDNFTVVLAPGDSFPFEEEFVVDSKLFELFLPDYTLKDFSTFPQKGVKNRRYRFDYFTRWGSNVDRLQLTYEFAFSPYVEDPDFLDKLNLKWKKYGQMPIGSDGTYSITSDPFLAGPFN